MVSLPKFCHISFICLFLFGWMCCCLFLWWENKPIFCPDERHYSYLSRLFGLQTSLKNSSKQKMFPLHSAGTQETHGESFLTCYCVRLFLPAICLLNQSRWMNEPVATFIVEWYFIVSVCLNLLVNLCVVLLLMWFFKYLLWTFMYEFSHEHVFL